jgi:hypothetical protein
LNSDAHRGCYADKGAISKVFSLETGDLEEEKGEEIKKVERLISSVRV